MALNRRMTGESRGNDPYVGAALIAVQTYPTTGRGLVIQTTGDISFTFVDGSTLSWTGIPVGVYPFAIASIQSATAVGYVLL